MTALSGVSVRTLHFYDQKGLLKPARRSEAGYRYYGETELLRLQQILFYRELDVPLKKIRDWLDDPEFDHREALQEHKAALRARKQRINRLISTIDQTILQLEKGTIMSTPEKLYEGLPREAGSSQREEAMKKYGKASIEQSEEALLKLGKEGFKQLKHDLEEIMAELYSLSHKAPDNEQVQACILRHYKIIRSFWGTSAQKDPQAEAYEGLGHTYVLDERYTMLNGNAQPEFARFLRQAMSIFAKTQLSPGSE